MHAGSRGQVQPADDDVASGRSEQEGVQRSLPGREVTGRSSGSRGFRARPPPGTPPLLAHATTASLTAVAGPEKRLTGCSGKPTIAKMSTEVYAGLSV